MKSKPEVGAAIDPQNPFDKIFSLLQEYKKWIEANPNLGSEFLSTETAIASQDFFVELNRQVEFFRNHEAERRTVFSLSEEELRTTGSSAPEPAWYSLDHLEKRLREGKMTASRWNSYIKSILNGIPREKRPESLVELQENLLLPEPVVLESAVTEPLDAPDKFIETREKLRRLREERQALMETGELFDEREFARANSLLAANGGIIGEEHCDYAPYIYLNQQLQKLKAQGITHLCLEYFKETDETMLSDYFASDALELPAALLDRIAVKDLMMASEAELGNYESYEAFGKAQRARYEDYKHGRLNEDDAHKVQDMLNHPEGFCSLIKKTKVLGIPIIPMDKAILGDLSMGDRVEQMNAYAMARIEALRREVPDGKPLIIVGELHASDCIIGEKTCFGLDSLLRLPSMSVKSAESTSFSRPTKALECAGEVVSRKPLTYQLGVNTQSARDYVEQQHQIRQEASATRNESFF